MKRETSLIRLQQAMMAVNLVIILYYSSLCAVTTFRLCRSFGAHDFLLRTAQLPAPPLTMPLRSLVLFAALCLLMVGKERLEVSRLGLRLLVCLGELALCVSLMAAMNFYYSGVVLLVLADLVHYVQRSGLRLSFMVVLLVLFAFGRSEFLAPRIPFQSYISYYSQGIQGWFSGMESMMVSLNIFLFVLAMVLLFTDQKEENARIQKLNEQLNEANLQLRQYSTEIERLTAIRERNRLAREIHDTLGHALTGIIMSAEACLVILDIAPEEVRKRLKVIGDTAREGLTDVRRSIKALRPDALEQRSLETALSTLVEHFCLTTNVAVEYRQEAGTLEFAPDEEDTIYRIVQESLTNAVRHGNASNVAISLRREEQTLVVHIHDNGSGSAEAKPGFGLRHMEERLKLLGGSLAYGNRTDQRGFYVTARIPLRNTDPEMEVLHD